MKKLIMVLMMAAAMVAAGKSLVSESVTVNGSSHVYTQDVSQAKCLVREAWGELEQVKAYVPANETGTVTVAAWQIGGWTNLLVAACTNDTSSAVVMDFDGGDAVFYGPVRVFYDQTGSGTNAWGSVLIIR